jgi:hypothetical protein
MCAAKLNKLMSELHGFGCNVTDQLADVRD